jgi:hypothetical protein
MSSNSSTSSLLTFQQPSSVVSPMTTLYSTTDTWSAFLAANTISSPASWEVFEAEVWNPYVPVILGPLGDGIPPSDSSYKALHQSCSLAWDASFYNWIATEEAKGIITSAATVECDPLTSGSSTCHTYTEIQLDSIPRFPFVAKPPCCGVCTFTAGDVQVYHWPLATEVPFTTRLVNSNGFTL